METNTVETVTTTPIDWGALLQTILNWLTTTGIRLVIGILLMIVLFKVINVISKKLYRRLEDRQVDETILRAGTGAFRVALKVLVTVCFVGYIGVETASISACIATLGVGISLAVQGTLSNFAGGVILILMRPFTVGDLITSSGISELICISTGLRPSSVSTAILAARIRSSIVSKGHSPVDPPMNTPSTLLSARKE